MKGKLKPGIFIALGLGLILMLQKSSFDTRGFRNRNPGNIRKVAANDWDGKVDGPDPEYETFVSFEYGIRALGKLLDTYHDRYNLTTIADIISRWAPPNENDTASYIRSVAQRMNFGPDIALPWTPDVKAELVAAIIHHENGSQPFSREFILKSLRIK